MKTWETKNGYKVFRIFGKNNAYLINYKNKNILADTCVKWDWRKLVRKLKKLNVHSIDLLILTHSHYDHAENALKIKKKYNAKTVIHNSEAGFLKKGETKIPKGTNRFTRFLTNKFSRFAFDKLKYDPCEPDILADNFFDLKEYGFNAYILHTPGHSEGSISVIVDNEIAIVGDAMFGALKWSIMIPFGDDIPKIIESWKLLLDAKCLLYLPAHGFKINRKTLENNYKNRADKMGQ